MTARLLAFLAVMVLTGCATNKSVVREPAPAAAPAVPAPGPVVIVPRVEPEPPLPAPAPSPPPEPPAPEKPAPATPVSSLLASVQAAVAAGELERGAALSERAVRISPRDAQLWYQLALIRYRQNRLEDAAGAARRALSLATNDALLLPQISSLLQELAEKVAAKAAR